MAFHALLRVSEMTDGTHNLKSTAIEFVAHHWTPAKALQELKHIVLVNFGTTKTDQTGQKRQLTWFTSQPTPLCPAKLLLDFLQIRPRDAHWLFCDRAGLPIKKEMFVKYFNLSCRYALSQSSSYATHSLWMGGAVFLLLNGWTQHQIMQKGRWATPACAQAYCDSLHLIFRTGVDCGW